MDGNGDCLLTLSPDDGSPDSDVTAELPKAEVRRLARMLSAAVGTARADAATKLLDLARSVSATDPDDAHEPDHPYTFNHPKDPD